MGIQYAPKMIFRKLFSICISIATKAPNGSHRTHTLPFYLSLLFSRLQNYFDIITLAAYTDFNNSITNNPKHDDKLASIV